MSIMATRIEIANYLEDIRRRFQSFKPAEQNVELWHRQLQDCPIATLHKALDEYWKDGKFAPAFSDLYKLALKISGGKFRRRPETANPEMVKALRADAYRAGLVPCYTDEGKIWVGWKAKDSCRQRGPEKWQLKIEYCMEKLGAGSVTAMLREKFGSSIADMMKRSSFAADYKQLLNTMVQLAETPPAVGF
jgi:hypothetical protein